MEKVRESSAGWGSGGRAFRAEATTSTEIKQEGKNDSRVKWIRGSIQKRKGGSRDHLRGIFLTLNQTECHKLQFREGSGIICLTWQIIQLQDDGVLDQDRNGSDGKWWSSEIILKAELFHALGVSYERKKGVKNDYNFIELEFERI